MGGAVGFIWVMVAILALAWVLMQTGTVKLGVDFNLWVNVLLVLAVLGGSIVLAAAGASVPLCMLVMVAVLGISIALDERSGHKGRAAALRRLEAAAG